MLFVMQRSRRILGRRRVIRLSWRRIDPTSAVAPAKHDVASSCEVNFTSLRLHFRHKFHTVIHSYYMRRRLAKVPSALPYDSGIEVTDIFAAPWPHARGTRTLSWVMASSSEERISLHDSLSRWYS